MDTFVCLPCVCSDVCGGQMDPLELELLAVVSCFKWVLGTELLVSSIATSAFSPLATFPSSLPFLNGGFNGLEKE